jgi:hypothetical protein
MATYVELSALIATPDGNTLRKRVAVAAVIAAQTLLEGTPTAEQKAWAKKVLADPDSESMILLRYAIADNAGSTPAQITGVSDSALQTAITAAVAKVI